MIVALGIVIGLIISIAVYFWDPPARASTFPRPDGIGGWLILPTIGCFLNPFFSIYNITTYFDHIRDGGVNLFNAEADQSEWLIYYCTSIFSESVQFVLCILLLVLLLKHRTSFPYAYIGFAVILLGSLVLDYALQSNVPSAEKTEGYDATIFSTAMKLAIWVAYMLNSQRVKATFRTHRKTPSPELPPPVTIPVN